MIKIIVTAKRERFSDFPLLSFFCLDDPEIKFFQSKPSALRVLWVQARAASGILKYP